MKPLFLYSTLLFLIGTANAQCISTSFANASIFGTDNSIGVYNFSSPGNAQTSNNSRASAGALVSILNGNTYYLKATGFNFNIPSYAMICGITVEAECRGTGLILTAAIRDNDVRLIKGGVITGNNYAKAGDWGDVDAYRSYGGGADLWGTSLSPADVNSTNFGIAFSARIIALIAALPDAEIDHIRMKIDYNPVLPIHLLYFSAFREKNKINLQWKTTEEEDEGRIILQRSSAQADWEDIRQYELHTNNSGEYHYTDEGLAGGRYAYRLKMIGATGIITYSIVRIIESIEEMNGVFVYPNPSSDFVFIKALKGQVISITDLYGRKYSIAKEMIGVDHYKFNIVSLRKGIYFINMGGKTFQFMKE
ncbi:MAG TPA: T9SS type A sorting domain-containing protein [Chitinophagaceae bacterium]